MSTESYGLSHEMRDKYYKAGSVPFNFDLINSVNRSCNGLCFKGVIEGALKDLPSYAWPNFVVSFNVSVNDYIIQYIGLILLTP